MDYLTSMNRKKHQRYVNKVVRKMNKDLAEDPLWRGRFICRQKEASFHIYDDMSGATLYVLLEMVDKKTGLTKKFWTDSFYLCGPFGRSKMFWEMNEFIVEDCDVWHKEDPRQNIIDYREVEI